MIKEFKGKLFHGLRTGPGAKVEGEEVKEGQSFQLPGSRAVYTFQANGSWKRGDGKKLSKAEKKALRRERVADLKAAQANQQAMLQENLGQDDISSYGVPKHPPQ